MKKLLLGCVLLCLASCLVENPHDLQEGAWVRHRIDSQKYYITYIDRINNIIKLKNELGVEVDKKFKLHELEPWVESTAEETITTDDSIVLKQVLSRLRIVHKRLDDANTEASRLEAGNTINEAEEVLNDLSPVFAARTWNHATGQYE